MERFHHGGEKKEWIQTDFSVNLNPLGMPSAAVRALNADRGAFEDYPDTECTELRGLLAEKTGYRPEQIVCGAGAADLIYRLPAAMELKKVLLPVPCFSEYERAFRINGVDITFLPVSEEDGYVLTDEYLSVGENYDAIIIANPGNPSGRLMVTEDFRRLLTWCAETGTILINDECFFPFVSQEKKKALRMVRSEIPEAEVISLHSFTKIYVMAGLRIGFALFDDPVRAEKMRQSGPPWSVPGPAQKAAVAVLKDNETHLSVTETLIREERQKLFDGLRGAGLKIWESDANYLLFQATDSFGRDLEREGILIRDCSNYRGLNPPAGFRFYRIAVGKEKDNRFLLESIGRILHQEKIKYRKKSSASVMIQGTMSNAGKSLIAAGLCRIFLQDGYHPAPFKSQNMALNSFITADGKEIGRAQAVQAEAAGTEPVSDMNPILLKPTSDKGSQIIVNGEARCSMNASDYYDYRKTLRNEVENAFNRLGEKHDILVIEGAGSPVEINLTKDGDDFVNTGLAEMTDSPVILVGDIDRGGIFAQLAGTMMLLDSADRDRVKGVIVNKFRGDQSLFEEGKKMLEEVCGVPVVGVVPYTDVDLDDEDSLSERLTVRGNHSDQSELQICVIRLPHLSNFSDMTALDAAKGVHVYYAERPEDLTGADALILPGSKNTMDDLVWMRKTGLADAILLAAAGGMALTGICGGYQMLGNRIVDRDAVENKCMEMEGLGLLPVITEYEKKKMTRQIRGSTSNHPGLSEELRNQVLEGYEIHMGRSRILSEDAFPFCVLDNGETDGCVSGRIFGTYLHGLFDSKSFAESYCRWVARISGKEFVPDITDYDQYRQDQYDRLADVLRQSLDLEYLYRIMGLNI